MGWPPLPDGLGLADGDIVVAAGEDRGDRDVVLQVRVRGESAGTVTLRGQAPGEAAIAWLIDPAYEGAGVPHRALRLAVDHCFSRLGLHRVEATIPVGDTSRLRIAARAGLRREGVSRGPDGPRSDLVRVARLATDPAPDSRDGFIGVLNANLPTKRVISQGLLRDEEDRILLCELTYKSEWDLPGGVVDPWESPATAVVRELREELGLDLPVQGLLAMNWMPPWRGWDDACQFVFDLGRRPASVVDVMALERAEIAAVHWCRLDEALPRIPDYLAVLLRRLLGPGPAPLYLEGGAELAAD